MCGRGDIEDIEFVCLDEVYIHDSVLLRKGNGEEGARAGRDKTKSVFDKKMERGSFFSFPGISLESFGVFWSYSE